MSRRRLLPIFLLLLTAALAGCGSDALAPFDWSPERPPRGVKEDFHRIGVCYNRQTATIEEVVEVARKRCDPGTTPALIGQDMLLTCPLFTPTRATFACLKPGMSLPVR